MAPENGNENNKDKEYSEQEVINFLVHTESDYVTTVLSSGLASSIVDSAIGKEEKELWDTVKLKSTLKFTYIGFSRIKVLTSD